MFGGPPPPPSKEELREQELVASATLASSLFTCALLYLSPFAVEYTSRFF